MLFVHPSVHTLYLMLLIPFSVSHLLTGCNPLTLAHLHPALIQKNKRWGRFETIVGGLASIKSGKVHLKVQRGRRNGKWVPAEKKTT